MHDLWRNKQDNWFEEKKAYRRDMCDIGCKMLSEEPIFAYRQETIVYVQKFQTSNFIPRQLQPRGSCDGKCDFLVERNPTAYETINIMMIVREDILKRSIIRKDPRLWRTQL